MSHTYDNSGQLISATGKEAGGTPSRLQEQLGYLYDGAGNLNHRTNNALLETFTLNAANELTRETNSGTLTVAGTSTGPATSVTVNSTSASRYADNTFAASGFTPVSGNNTYTAIAQDTYSRKSTNAITCYLPNPVSYTYDANGNLLTDGTRNFAYDDENQLIAAWVTNAWQSKFVYDGKMRRRIRKEYAWQSGSWVETNEVHYIYDGNVVIQERDLLNFPQVTYTRGTDLSGKLQSAGGIGGLLARTDNHLSAINSPLSTSFYHCDGNGNITCLINSFQAVVARYLYDPFGNILSQSGSLAGINLYCFSSKEYHPNSGLIYYGYRFYDPNLQRWVNRDPIGDLAMIVSLSQRRGRAPSRSSELREGINLFSVLRNDPLDKLDPLGLYDYSGDDDNYIVMNGKFYNKRCLANAKATAIDCAKDIGMDAAGSFMICVIGCLPTLVWGLQGYELCVIGCLGLDAMVHLYDLAGCLDQFVKAQKACEVCQPTRGSTQTTAK